MPGPTTAPAPSQARAAYRAALKRYLDLQQTLFEGGEPLHVESIERYCRFSRRLAEAAEPRDRRAAWGEHVDRLTAMRSVLSGLLHGSDPGAIAIIDVELAAAKVALE